METYKLHDKVKIIGKNVKGKIAFIGKTHFVDGILYGVIMDDAKGRHNGTVNGVRYFKCPDNHGAFVRACQLERDYSNSKNKDKDGKVVTPSRPKYPNYLSNRSKLSSEQPRCQNKSKEFVPNETCEAKTSNATSTDFKQKTAPKKNEKCSKFSEVKDKYKLKKEDLAQRTSEKLSKVMSEVTVLKTDLDCRNKQIAILQGGLCRLKSCLRWNKKFSSSNSLKDINLKRFLSQEIDVTIKNMEDTISSVDTKQFHDFSNGDASLKEQNNFLFQHILNLEKQTEVLMETMLRIRTIILNQRKKRNSDQKPKHDKKLIPKEDESENNNYEYSSRCFSDGDVTDCDRVSPKAQPRGLKTLMYNKHPVTNNQTSFETFKSDLDVYNEMGDKCNLNKIKQEVKHSFLSIPDENESENPFNLPVRRYLRADPKPHALISPKKSIMRYQPYSLNTSHKQDKSLANANEKTFDISKEFEDFINDIVMLSSQTDEPLKHSFKDSTTHPSAELDEKTMRSNPPPFESDSDSTDVTSLDCRRKSSHKAQLPAKGKVSVIRRKPLRKKTVYSTRVLSKKEKTTCEEK